MTYTPKLLIRLSSPEGPLGAAWPQYYSSGVAVHFLSRVRERSNFAATLHALGGESETVRAIYSDWIVIHESDSKSLVIADAIQAGLAESAVVDFDYLYEFAQEEAHMLWKACFDARTRIAYIRNYDIHFTSFKNLIGCVRGEFFPGDASELVEELSA